MAILKCKMCGGNLEVNEGASVVTCEYCDTKQTVPNVDNEKKATLFSRANRLRFTCEFDKAAAVYESIVAEFPEEAEGYWGLILCSYGIEYVDDPETGKKIPTCHRTNPTSVMDDDNFIQTLENADVISKSVYREQAKAIDILQKQIFAVVEKEQPYDVFICYKETDDATRQRTEDSSIAQDIYTELIKEGYKVFFSRVTLREKAGSEYEPYIYAALKSAKVMLAIATKYDYYDAVWVKNEWSRFVHMMGQDSDKHLIPCYKNLDAYDIPKEFKNLQALDMGVVTFFKSLTENVRRFIPREQVEKAVEVKSTSGATPLIKRAYIYLEDGLFNEADNYFEKALDIDPENAEAYLGKLIANLKLKNPEALTEADPSFEQDSNYIKALRYADSELRAQLERYSEKSRQNKNHRIEQQKLEKEQQLRQFVSDNLQKGNELLEKELYAQAEKAFLDILAKDETVSDAYFGILKAQRQLSEDSKLAFFPSFEKDENYIKAKKYADEQTIKKFELYNAYAVLNSLFKVLEYALSDQSILMESWAKHYKNSSLCDNEIAKCVDIILKNRGLYAASPLVPGAILKIVEYFRSNPFNIAEISVNNFCEKLTNVYNQYMDNLAKFFVVFSNIKKAYPFPNSKKIEKALKDSFGESLCKNRYPGPSLFRDNLIYHIGSSRYVFVGGNKAEDNGRNYDKATPENMLTSKEEIIDLWITPLKAFEDSFKVTIKEKISSDPSLISIHDRTLYILGEYLNNCNYFSHNTPNFIRQKIQSIGEIDKTSKAYSDFIKKLEKAATDKNEDFIVDLALELIPESRAVNLKKLCLKTRDFSPLELTLPKKYMTSDHSLSQQNIDEFCKCYLKEYCQIADRFSLEVYAKKAGSEKWPQYKQYLNSLLEELTEIYRKSINCHRQNVEKENKKGIFKNLFNKNTEQKPVIIPDIVLPENGGKIVYAFSGTVKEIKVANGQSVEKGQVLILIQGKEKIYEIKSPEKGTVCSIMVSIGQKLDYDSCLAVCVIK